MTKPSKKKSGAKATKRGRAAEASKKGLDLSTGAGTTGGEGKRSGGGGEDDAGSASRAKGVSGVPGSKNPSRRCTAKAHRTGERCRAAAIKGGTVCRVHGGATPAVREKAQERLMAMVEPALTRLQKIVRDPATTDADALRAVREVLNRTGFSERFAVDLIPREQTAWDRLGDDALDLEVDRSLPEPEGGSDAIDAANRHALAKGMSDDAWREVHDEETREYLQGRIEPDEETIQGEVVPNKPNAAGPLTDGDEAGPIPPAGYDRRPGGGSAHDPTRYPGRYEAPPRRPRDAPPDYEPVGDPDEHRPPRR